MASSSSASSSGAKANAVVSSGDAKADAQSSNLALWAKGAILLARSLLNLGKANGDEKVSLSSMPVNEHAQCLQLVSQQLELQCDAKADARNPVLRWKYTKDAVAILSQGASILDGYVLDTIPRKVFAVADSTVVTKNENTNSDDSGALFARAYSALTGIAQMQ